MYIFTYRVIYSYIYKKVEILPAVKINDKKMIQRSVYCVMFNTQVSITEPFPFIFNCYCNVSLFDKSIT